MIAHINFLIFQKIHIHPEYRKNRRYNDIGLIELATPMTFAINVKPICLQTDPDDSGSSRNLTVIGFGVRDVNTGKNELCRKFKA